MRSIPALAALLCISLALFSLPIGGCDEGLQPPPIDSISYLSGTIHFAGTYPPCDSVKLLAVVLAQPPAPFQATQLLAGLNTIFYAVTLESCTFRDTSFTFTVKPGTYHYLGVAQNYGSDLTKDWRVVGFAHTELDSPMTYFLEPGKRANAGVVQVRFDSLPRQPFIP
jgi:hypothetical protein